MTLVTTSRRAPQDVRQCAKEFAFAAGCVYRPRGKSGFRDLEEMDTTIFLFSRTGSVMRIQVFAEVTEKLSIAITDISVNERDGIFSKGLEIADEILADIMGTFVPVRYTPENSCMISFDGRQKRQYHLQGSIGE
ncbi:MAG: hypothetical protein JXA44_13895 [Methanospirillaceae archaeon]|nr:hypothetical protein [Methanospirillaceae archaeon]